MPTFGSLFAGAGLMDLGFEQAGWECRWAVEWDKSAVQTWQHNRPEIADRVILGDIRKVQPEQLSEVDLIIGGPPCQGFSTANSKRVHVGGKTHLWKEDPKNLLYREYLRLVTALRPKYFVMENVKNMFTNGASEVDKPGPIMIEVLTDFTLAGYRVAADVLDAADYGVPQHRERVFVIGVRADLPDSIRYPVQTHGDKDSGFLPWQTVRMAIGDLPEPGTHIVVDAQSTYPNPYKSLDEPANALRSCVSGCGLMMGQGLMPANHEGAMTVKPDGYGFQQKNYVAEPDQPAPTINANRLDRPPVHPGPMNHKPAPAPAPSAFTAEWQKKHAPMNPDEPADTIAAKQWAGSVNLIQSLNHNPTQDDGKITVNALHEWGMADRPANTLQADPRMSKPGHHNSGLPIHPGPLNHDVGDMSLRPYEIERLTKYKHLPNHNFGGVVLDPESPSLPIRAQMRDASHIMHPGPMNHENTASGLTIYEGYESTNRPLDGNAPAPTVRGNTVTGQPLINEPQPRRLTPRECARLQSVPDWYFFCGSKSATYRGIGNGVPVELARRIAATLIGSEPGRELKPYQIQLSFLDMLG